MLSDGVFTAESLWGRGLNAPLSLPHSLAQFEGRWQLERQIHDAERGEMQLAGEAVLARSGHRLVYNETGQLQIAGQRPLTATRRYIWQDRAGWVAISFADGRPFHGFALNAARASAVHLCDPDRYEVSYDFSAWPEWSSEWQVTGPRKAYTMRSRYLR